MKRLIFLVLAGILLISTVTAFADEGKTLPTTDQTGAVASGTPADQPQGNDPAKYELGALRVLVYEQARKASDRAVVYVNDVKHDNSPVFLEGLKPGDYAIRVVAPKASWSGTVTVEAGKTAGLDVTIDKNKASADLYQVLLWEDFLDNRNGWETDSDSGIINGSLYAKTERGLGIIRESTHSFQDFSIEANFRIKQRNNTGTVQYSYNGPTENIPDAVFGYVLRMNGSGTLLLFESSGGTINHYYLVSYDDIEYYSNPIVLSGEMKAPIKDAFRVKVLLRNEEMQIFVDGKLSAIAQVKFTNAGNVGIALGPGLTVEVENVTVGKG